jgi:AraC-like DNA-binding protein
MFRKIIALLSLWLSIFSFSGASDIKSKIAAAQGQEKLKLILQFFQGFEQVPNEQKERQLLDRYAQEALALSEQFHDRHAEGLARKYAAYSKYLQQQYEPALEDYFQARRIFGELRERNDEAAINKEIGDLFSIVFFVFSDYGRAGEYYKKSLALSRQSKNQFAITENLNNIANIYRAQGNFQEAISLYLEALQLNERYNTLFDSGAILSNLSDTFLKSGNFAESMNYMRQAFVFYEKTRQTQVRGRMYSQKGISCMQQNDFPRALSYFQQALEIHKKYSEIGKTTAELRNLGLLYSRFKKNAKAQECFQQALSLRQQRNDQIEIIQTLLVQAVTLQKQNELAKAEALLLFCENQAIQKQLQEKLCETYLQVSSLYSLRHDPVNALYYQTLGKKTKDGLPSAVILAGMQKLIAKHESNKEIDKIKMQKRRQTIVGLLAICLLLTLIGILAGKQKSIKNWIRNHLSSKEQQLQKKKAQWLDMRQKLDELQKKQSRSTGEMSPTGSERGQECLQLVLQKMQNDKIFLDSEMTLKKMAAKVGANTSSFSKTLNKDLGMGFNDFINYFRIEEAKKIMLADDQNKWDAVDICYEVGFNSMSSFYRIFKMHTGTTPVEFQHACKR